MAALAERAAARAEGAGVTFAFSEQGAPSLREVLHQLRDRGVGAVRLIPLMLPMEPSFPRWVTRMLQRWQAEDPGGWPQVRVGPSPLAANHLDAVIDELVTAPENAEPESPSAALAAEGSAVPTEKYRVLVCDGAPCANAGTAAIWSHLRSEQKRLGLRTAGDGMLSTRTSCLGPCNLAPVLQVWPDGIYYGGVDEAAIDRIIGDHLLGGTVVDDLAYQPSRGKQTLRAR